jgi:hypothetical protein
VAGTSVGSASGVVGAQAAARIEMSAKTLSNRYESLTFFMALVPYLLKT